MQNSATDTTEASAHRRDGISRRALLAVAGAGVAGSVAAVDTARAAYRPGDQNLSFTCSSSYRGVVVEASWTWDREDSFSGERPEDVAVIYWDSAEWKYNEGSYQTSDGVRFERHHSSDGVQGVEFRHDDESAFGGTEYSASVRLGPHANDSIVYHDYTHTYGDTYIFEVSVGRDEDDRPISTVRTSDDEKKWEKNRDLAAWECDRRY
jgi:hypothetical protein